MPLELLEDHSYDRADLFIVIEFEAALLRANVADGWSQKDSTTTNLIEQPLAQTTSQDVQFCFAHRPFQTTEKTIVWIIESILICQYGPKERAEFKKMMPIFARTS